MCSGLLIGVGIWRSYWKEFIMNQIKFNKGMGFKRSLGFTAIEISLALIISAFVAFALFKSNLTSFTQQGGVVQADQLLQVRNALQNYASANGAALVAGSAISGVSAPLQPTVAELVNLQLLPSSFETLATLNKSPFATRLNLSPTPCVLGTCTITGFVYIRDPFVSKGDDATKGQYDGVVVSSMLSRLGGSGFARVVPNNSLVAAGGTFTIPNTVAVAHPTIAVNGQPYPAGVVGVQVAAVTPPAPAAAAAAATGAASLASGLVSAATGTTGIGVPGPCPGGAIDNVPIENSKGKSTGVGNQCKFVYPVIDLGETLDVANSQPSTKGSVVLSCVAINGQSTLQVQSLECKK